MANTWTKKRYQRTKGYFTCSNSLVLIDHNEENINAGLFGFKLTYQYFIYSPFVPVQLALDTGYEIQKKNKHHRHWLISVQKNS